MDHLLRATARAEEHHFWFRGFRYFVEPLVQQATANRTNVSILDCGCGTGANVDWLSKYGRTWGFDVNEAGLQLAHEGGRRQIVRASVAAVPFPSERFDLVTSFDVLYSLDAPTESAAVGEMFRVVRPGGWMIVNVAAMDVLRGDHSILSHERRRYNRASLCELVSGGGFEIARLTYTNATLFVPMVIARTWQRWRGLQPEERSDREISEPPTLVNALLTTALRLESWWLSWMDSPFGSSMLCLARKPATTVTETRTSKP